METFLPHRIKSAIMCALVDYIEQIIENKCISFMNKNVFSTIIIIVHIFQKGSNLKRLAIDLLFSPLFFFFALLFRNNYVSVYNNTHYYYALSCVYLFDFLYFSLIVLAYNFSIKYYPTIYIYIYI